MHVHVCACVGVWMPEVEFGCRSSGLLFEAVSLKILLIQLDWIAGELHSLAGSVSPALSLQCASPCPAFYIGSGGRKLYFSD